MKIEHLIIISVICTIYSLAKIVLLEKQIRILENVSKKHNHRINTVLVALDKLLNSGYIEIIEEDDFEETEKEPLMN